VIFSTDSSIEGLRGHVAARREAGPPLRRAGLSFSVIDRGADGDVARLLRDQPIGDGTVHRAWAQMLPRGLHEQNAVDWGDIVVEFQGLHRPSSSFGVSRSR
jgi:hypothetical protein